MRYTSPCLHRKDVMNCVSTICADDANLYQNSKAYQPSFFGKTSNSLFLSLDTTETEDVHVALQGFLTIGKGDFLNTVYVLIGGAIFDSAQ